MMKIDRLSELFGNLRFAGICLDILTIDKLSGYMAQEPNYSHLEGHEYFMVGDDNHDKRKYTLAPLERGNPPCNQHIYGYVKLENYSIKFINFKDMAEDESHVFAVMFKDCHKETLRSIEGADRLFILHLLKLKSNEWICENWEEVLKLDPNRKLNKEICDYIAKDIMKTRGDRRKSHVLSLAMKNTEFCCNHFNTDFFK